MLSETLRLSETDFPALLVQLAPNAVCVASAKRCADTDNQVHGWQSMSVLAKPFADNPFHIIALVCAFCCFFGNDQTQTRMCQPVIAGERNGQGGTAYLPS